MKLIHQVIKIRSIRISPSLINKLNNMETKELKVQAPEGYEIDKEKSTLECIKFKPIKKNITYEYICNEMFKDETFYISERGNIMRDAKWDGQIVVDRNIATNVKQLKKLLALNQLLNIVEYYNKQHSRQNNTQYYIIKNNKNGYDIVEYKWLQYILGVVALFTREEDAQAVIDNPNFREILDTIYKD